MKRTTIFLICLCVSGFTYAQQVAQDTLANDNYWSSETKTYWLISIITLSLFLVARTFRNKPEA